MIVILSSAKTQNVIPLSDLPLSQPSLLHKTKELVRRCQELNRDEIRKIMKVSEKLADSTYLRFQDFTIPHHETSASPALSTFAGDVFSELRYQHYGREDFLHAQERVRILSGLYGILCPLDLMQPYRLEMGYKLGIGEALNLYEYWAESITVQLNRDLKRTGSTFLINCASKEYSRAVLSRQLDGTMLNLSFKQRKNGTIKSIAIYAKRARGMFVDWFITKRITTPEQLMDFNRAGYRFAEEFSSDQELVFITNLQT